MSDRPTDWSAVGRDCDPTPGDPVVVRDGGQKYQNIAGALSRAAATLRRLNGGASSGSDSVTALLEDCDEIAEQLSTAQNRYQAAGDALVTYAYALDQIQATTLQALYTANTARESMAENTRLADQYARWASYANTPEQAEDCAYYLRMEATYRTAAAGDQSTIEQQKQIIDQAVADRDRAANTAIAQIEDVTSTDGLNDSWWDDWGAKIVSWIATIAEAVAAIAGILALVLCWVPILGQALLAIAAIAGVVAAVANIALAATGEKSWTEAIVSIVFAALGCVGLGGLRGVLGAVKGGAMLAKGGLPAFAGVFKAGSQGLASMKTGLIVFVARFKNASGTVRSDVTLAVFRGPSQAVPGGQIGPRVSIKMLKQELGRAGMSIRGYTVKHVPHIEGPLGPALGVTEYTGGRAIIKISDMGLQDMDTAVITVFHEIFHANSFVRCGRGGEEKAAETFGQAMLDKFKGRIG